VPSPKHAVRVAVVGAGPAGLAAATVAASRGHAVTLFDASARVGGQFNLAKRIPGKEEFYETIRYFEHKLEETAVRAAPTARCRAAAAAAASAQCLHPLTRASTRETAAAPNPPSPFPRARAGGRAP
jgi:NADPH-dependent 2,4-dienoyl-CoA reductase/sulfur reductase-like enzyme